MIPTVVVITDWSIGERALLEKLEAALSSGAPIAVQHRNPGATTRVYCEQAERLKAVCERFGAPIFVSARLDVALALGTHLHLPTHALRPADVRQKLPAGRWISASVHDARELADAAGADLVLISPVFESPSKPGAKAIGAAGFDALAGAARCPAYALGGMTAALLPTLPRARGVAAISAVLHAEDPAAAVRALSAALGAPS